MFQAGTEALTGKGRTQSAGSRIAMKRITEGGRQSFDRQAVAGLLDTICANLKKIPDLRRLFIDSLCLVSAMTAKPKFPYQP